VRLRTLTISQKSLVAAISAALALGVFAVPAAAAGHERSTSEPAASVHMLRPIDQDAAYFASVAQGTARLAHGKVSTASIDLQLALAAQSNELPADTARTVTVRLRQATTSVAAQVVRYDKEQAHKAAVKKAAAERARKAAAAERARKAAAAAKAKQQAQARAASAASTGSAAPAATGDNSPSAARAYAKSLMASKYGWGADQFSCLNSLWNRESGWRVHAANPSGAYGIPQALPGSKMGAGWQNSARVQVAWGLGYIKSRYGTPCGAWSHSQSSGWY
jgi:type IV secretory pathway VirB10-like protein